MSSFVYFGTPYVARDTLATLVAQGFVPTLVVTSPDAPRGRGQQLAQSETKTWALTHRLPVYTPEKLDASAIEKLRAVGADYAVVVAYGKILPKALITLFPQGVLNVHYSLLPKYRGASPVEAALLSGDTVTGVSLQRMVYQLDAGDVLASRDVAIESAETTRELRPRLVAAGAELLVDSLPAFLSGGLRGEPQHENNATFCRKMDKKDGELDLFGDPQANWNKYRAYAESPGTYFFIHSGDRQVRVKMVTATFDGTTFTPLRVIPEGKKETDFSTLRV